MVKRPNLIGRMITRKPRSEEMKGLIYMHGETSLKVIPITDIRANEVALREVDRDGEGFKEIAASVGQRGILIPILVRAKKDVKTGTDFYEIIDGLHRYTAALENDLKQIPAQIVDADDATVMEDQVIANVQRVETKPVEFTKGLLRILSMNPTLTESALAVKLGKSPAWISDRLSLTKLADGISELVNEGKIPLSNAYPLTKLPKEEQASWATRAQTENVQTFAPAVVARAKEIRDANRKGRDATPEVFKAHPFLRKLAELKEEFENPQAGPALVAANQPKSLEDAFALGVAWAVNMDPESQKVAEAKNEERKKLEADARLKRDAEKTAQRAKEAAERQAKLTAEADEAKRKAEAAGVLQTA